MKKQKNILLALGWYDHRLLHGVAAYAAEHNWHISAASITHEFVIPWGWKGDGVLAWLAGEEDLTDFVVSLKKPTVDFSLRRPHLPFAHVALNHEAIARLAADHFLRRGFRNFLFYSDADNWTFEERGSGFVAALQEHGHACEWIKWHESKAHQPGREEWLKRGAWLAAHIKLAKKPLAVFSAHGTLAVEVLEVCELSAMDVPGQVAIIGVEDNLLLPHTVHRSITAVDPNLEEQGYQGAALLDRLMNGEPRPLEAIRIQPARIITRQSTDIMAVRHPGLANALRFIAENFSRDIGVDDVARIAGMSRRGLHGAFLEHLGHTPGEQIRTTRIENSKKLLAETDGKVEAVAKLSGYPSVNSFYIAFKQACGTSPVEYRKEVRRAR